MNQEKNFPRIITGGLLLLLLFTMLILSGGYIFLLTLIFTLLAMWEFYAMFWHGDEGIGGRMISLLMGGIILTTGWLNQEALLPIIGISFIFITVYTLITSSHSTALYFKQVGILLFGIFYIPILLVPILWCTPLEQFFLICIVAISDSTAYFVGLTYGNHKIWPKISPRKSIEGSAAGLIACIIISSILGVITGKANILSFIILTSILGIVAQLGDFFESALKRATHLKDSGTILPGHGGILDRSDSLLFVIPTYALLKSFIVYF